MDLLGTLHSFYLSFGVSDPNIYALVHRMWDIPASIKISMYSDKIEISSPGGLPAGISEDEYLNGQISLLRNPIIGNVFFRLKYIEN